MKMIFKKKKQYMNKERMRETYLSLKHFFSLSSVPRVFQAQYL